MGKEVYVVHGSIEVMKSKSKFFPRFCEQLSYVNGEGIEPEDREEELDYLRKLAVLSVDELNNLIDDDVFVCDDGELVGITFDEAQEKYIKKPLIGTQFSDGYGSIKIEHLDYTAVGEFDDDECEIVSEHFTVEQLMSMVD